MDIERAIADYDELVARALEVVEGAPYWAYVDQPRYGRLSISKDLATITWPEADTSYDVCLIEVQEVSFPAGLLTIERAELEAWKAEQNAEYDRKQMAIQRAHAEAVKQQEMAVLAALKAKYEGTH